MAVKNACWIRTDEFGEFVFSVTVVDEADYAFLQSIWGMFYPGDYIIWQDDLAATDGYILPVGEGWRPDGVGAWYNPAYVPPEDPGV